MDLATQSEYQELLEFYNNRGQDLLRSGPLKPLPDVQSMRLFDRQWTRIIVMREAQTNQIIGGAMICLQQTMQGLIGHVEYLLVDRDFRRNQFGRALMLCLHEEAHEAGVSKILLVCEYEREAARNLFYDLGYKLVRDSKEHFELAINAALPA